MLTELSIPIKLLKFEYNMQHDLTNLQKKNERRLPAVAKSFLYESKRNF